MSEQSDVTVERQRDAVDRLDRLLERAQQHPETPLGDQTVIAEILDVRKDLLSETRDRLSREKDFVLRDELKGIKATAKWFLGIVTAMGLAAFSWWLGGAGHK